MPQDQYEKQSKWKTRAYTTWTLVGICILVGVILYICNIIWQAVATVIITALAVFLLHGIVNWLQAHKMPRVLAVTITFIVVSALVVGCILSLIPTLITQLASFVGNLSSYSAQIQDFVSRHSDSLGSSGGAPINDLLTSVNDWIRNQASSILSTAANGVVGSIVGIGNAAVIGFISLVCSFWILLDLPVIARELRGLFPDNRQKDIDIFAKAFGDAVYGWAKSTFICAIITGVASGLSFWA
ncbi:MAG: AI-2E family transporter, partial [Coriobacteriales bacterium]